MLYHCYMLMSQCKDSSAYYMRMAVGSIINSFDGVVHPFRFPCQLHSLAAGSTSLAEFVCGYNLWFSVGDYLK